MQYSNNYGDVFILPRVCIKEEIVSKYSLFTTLRALNQPVELYQIEDTADMLTAYNELTGSDLFFRFRDFKN